MKSNVSPSPLCQAVTLDQVMPFIERQPPYDVAIMVADPLPINVLVGLTFALHTVHASCCAAFNRTGPVAGSPVPSGFPRGLPGWVL